MELRWVPYNNLISWSAHSNSSSPTFITSDRWLGLIHDNVLKQCDTIDAVADGIIEDPNLCDHKPEELSNSSNCLTAEQAAALRLVYSPMYSEDGNLMYPRMQLGSENADYIEAVYGGDVFQYPADWFHYVVFNPSFDVNTLNLTDYTIAQ